MNLILSVVLAIVAGMIPILIGVCFYYLANVKDTPKSGKEKQNALG